MRQLIYAIAAISSALISTPIAAQNCCTPNNYSIELDGQDDYVEIPTEGSVLDFYNKNEITISAWVKLNSIAQQYSIFTHSAPSNTDQQYAFKIDQGRLYFLAGNGSFEANGINKGETYLAVGQWYFATFTYDGNTVRLYLDGELDFENNVEDEFPNEPYGIAWIGNSYGANNVTYPGSIDEVSVWDRALSQSEIQEFMTCPPSGMEENIVGFWNFEEGGGDIAIDKTQYENHGVLKNGASYGQGAPSESAPQIEQEDMTICPGEEVELNFISSEPEYEEIDSFNYMGCFQGNHYYLSNYLSSWTSAFNICQENNGHMLTINSEEEQNFVASIVSEGPNIHLGANNTDTWITGEPITYSNWNYNDLSNNYAEFYWSNFQWGMDPEAAQHRTCLEIENVGCQNVNWSTGETALSILVSPNETTTYWVEVTQDGVTCTDEVTITVEDIPDSLPDSIITCDESVILTAAEGYNYLWSTGETTQSITVDESGEYEVMVSDIEFSENDVMSLAFDGYTDYINLGNETYLFNNSNYATFSAWIKSTENINWNAIITRWNNVGNTNYWFGLGSNGRIHFGTGGFGPMSVSYSDENAYSTDGQWYHVCVVMDHQNITYYSNGQEVGIASHDYNIISDADLGENLLIGAKNNGEGDLFDGNIKSVVVWDQALTVDEIQQFMSCPPEGDEEGLVGFWNFNEGSGDIVTDLSGNGNHGSIIGSTYSDDTPESNCQIGCSLTETVQVSFVNVEIEQDDMTICSGQEVELSLDISGIDSSSNFQQACSLDELPSNIQDGLVAWYPFCGNANDASGNGNHGSVSEATLIEDRFGNSQSAYNFDVSDATGWGSPDDRIDVNYSSEMMVDKITLSAWVKPDYKQPPYANRPHTICSRWTNGTSNEVFRYQINYDTNELYFQIRDEYGNNYSLSGGIVPYHQWSFVVATYDGDSIKLYVNGDQVAEEYLGVNLYQGQSDLTIGDTEMSNGYWYYFSGQMDEIGYWNRALSSEEIFTIYNGESSSSVISEVLWSTGETTSEITVSSSETTTYLVEVTQNGFTCSDEVTITVEDIPDSLPDSIITCDESVILTAAEGYNYLWSTGETTQSITVDESGEYSVEVLESEITEDEDWSLSYDGEDDKVSLEPSTFFEFTDKFSFTSWVKIPPESNGQNWNTVLGGYLDYRINIYAGSNNAGSGSVYVELPNLSGSSFYGSTDLRDDVWHHIAVTYNGENAIIYIDGLIENVESKSGNIQSSSNFSNNLFIGDANHTSNEQFHGKLNNVGLWNICLNETQILSMTSCPTIGDEEGLVGFWDFNEGSGGIANDLSGNGNHGSIIGSTYSNDTPENNCQLGCSLNETVQVSFLDVEIDQEDMEICIGEEVELSLENVSAISSCQSTNYIDLDGEDDYINLGDVFNNISFPVSFQTKVKLPVNFEGSTTLFHTENSLQGSNYMGIWSHFDQQGISIEYGDGGGQGPPHRRTYKIDNLNLDLDTWYTVTTIIRGPTDMSIYVDGQEYDGVYSGYGGSLYHSSNPFLIGRVYVSGYSPSYYTHDYNYFSYWDKELSQNEINSFLVCDPIGNEPDLLVYYDFEDYDEDFVYDLSPNNIDGSLVGTPQIISDNSFIDILWSTGEIDPSITVSPTETTTYWVEVTQDGATCTDEVAITVNSIEAGLPESITTCDEMVTLTAAEGYEYLWSTGETVSQITVEESGVYDLELTVPEAPNSSLSFDGDDDFVSINTSVDQDYSICGWINCSDQSQISDAIIATDGSAFYRVITEDEGFVLGYNSPTGANPAGTEILYPNTWSFFTIVSEGSDLKFYVDGVNDITLSEGSTPMNFRFIGKAQGQHTIQALMDDIQVWDYPLSQDEILNLMSCSPEGDESGLVSYWNFNEGSGSFANDLAGDSNGSIYGATYSEDTPETNCQQGCAATASVEVTIDICDCTDPSAVNYNPEATSDDESCIYCQNEIITGLSTPVACPGDTVSIYGENFCLPVGVHLQGWTVPEEYIVSTSMTEIVWVVPETVPNYSIVQTIYQSDDGLVYSNTLPLVNGVYGCTDSNSINYDSLATCDDGSCIPIVEGCVYELACNYDQNANVDDGSCVFETTSTTEEISCDSFLWNGEEYTSSGIFNYVTESTNGCDSIATLILTINNSTSSLTHFTACDSYEWNGEIYTETGLYSFESINDAGCTHTDNLDLYIFYSTTGSSNIEACESYNWNGQLITESGVYTQTFDNSVGCDSTHTLTATINYPTYSTDVIEACDSYTWIDGNTYSSSIFGPTFTETNEDGCDHVVTLDLTIDYSIETEFTIEACDSYEWNGVIYTESGQYIHVIESLGVGDEVEGGVLFYINEQEGYGLVAASTNQGIGEWGCYGTDVNGILGAQIGEGSSNTNAILANNCTSTNGGAIAAEIAVAPLNGYSDWYLPSLDELEIIYNELYASGLVDYDSGDVNNWYWSSTECDSDPEGGASCINFGPGTIGYCNNKNSWQGGVIPIRLVELDNQVFEGCTETEILNLTILESTTGSSNIEACESYNWNGQLITESGIYTQTFDNSVGCDSTHTLTATINFPTYSTDVIEACDSYTWIDGNTYSSSIFGPTFTETNDNGCYHVVTLDLTIEESTSSYSYMTHCNSYNWNGETYSESGLYSFTSENSVGCDSTAYLYLTIVNSTQGSSSVFACEDYNWNGLLITESGTYTQTFTNVEGCDSVHTITATIGQPSYETQTIEACDSYTWIDGNTYTNSTSTPTYTQINAEGCDHVISLDLTITNSTDSYTYITECESFDWNDNTYTQSGVYTYETTNAAGCDSTATLDLTILESTIGTSSIEACDIYVWDGIEITLSGTYSQVYTNAAGCDSTHILTATIGYSTYETQTIDACDSYTWIDGNTYTNSTSTPTHTQTNAEGCDHVISLDLTITNSTDSYTYITECDSYGWNDNTYTQSGVYTFETTNAAGCDSTATLDLTILESTFGSNSLQVCNSYNWNGQIITEPGSYTQTFINAAGCDSTHILNISIGSTTYETQTFEACDSYTWIDGNTYTNSTTSPTFTTTNAEGCDHIITLDLTILESTFGISLIEACDSYTWNGQLITESGEYTQVFTNAAGCDSTHTLTAVIGYTTYATHTHEACDSFEWIDGNTYTESNNSAMFTLTNQAGCDSIVTLDLTINESFEVYNEFEICEGESIQVGPNTYTEPGSYLDMFTTEAGCDSTVHTMLTVNPNSLFEQFFELCEGESITINGNELSEDGIYVDSLTNSNGCDSLVVTTIEVFELPPTAQISGVLLVLTPNSTYFVSGQSNSTYQWSVDLGTITSGQGTDQIHVDWDTNIGTATVSVTEIFENGCEGETTSIDITLEIHNDVEELDSEDFIKVYPNPFTESTTLEFSNPNSDEYLIQLIDERGRTIRTYESFTGNRLVIERGGIARGIYYVVLQGRESINRGTIVVQ